MLHNNLDPEVAEHPEELVVYGGTGKAARDWASFDALVRTLTTLRDDETMLVQSGKPVGVMRTHEWAPRVLIANSNLVPDWATWDEFRRLDALGLTMYGQMTAGSWIYIGTQGILQGTFETFAAVADKRFGGTLAGTLTLTAGLGGMGGRAAAGGHDERRRRARRRVRPVADRPPARDPLPRRGGRRPRRRAAPRRDRRRRDRTPLSIGLLGNAADVVPEILRRGVEVDVVTDQTSAHDPLALPARRRRVRGLARRARGGPGRVHQAGARVDGRPTSRRWSASRTPAPRCSTTATPCAARRRPAGTTARSPTPGFVPAYIRPLFCEGKGPFRWAALSGDPADIRATDEAILELFPDDDKLHRWIRAGAGQGRLPGAAGPHLLARLRRTPPRRRAVQRPGGVGRGAGTDRDRARPPRLRLGRLAAARDRGDARRLRRDRGLAAAQRHGQRRLGRGVGVDPPRRRGRHGPLDPRRPGHASPTAPTSPRRSSNGCSPTTRAWASSATSTPATTGPSRSPSNATSASPCAKPDPAGRWRPTSGGSVGRLRRSRRSSRAMSATG